MATLNKKTVNKKKATSKKRKSPSTISAGKTKKAKTKVVYKEPLILPPPAPEKPKRRRWVVKEEAGRQRIISTEEELQEKIDEYFETQVGLFPAKDIDGDIITKPSASGLPQIVYNRKSPTITGLALFLGFASRQSIYDYMKEDGKFSYTIKRAVARIEEWAENIILGGGIGGSTATAGAIYWTKCHGWKADDKDEQEEYANILKKLAEIEIKRNENEQS